MRRLRTHVASAGLKVAVMAAVNPLRIAATRMAVVGGAEYGSVGAALTSVVRTEGAGAFLRGLDVSLLRSMGPLSSWLSFALQTRVDVAVRALARALMLRAVAAAAALALRCVCVCFVCVRALHSRVTRQPGRVTSSLDVARGIVREDGWTGARDASQSAGTGASPGVSGRPFCGHAGDGACHPICGSEPPGHRGGLCTHARCCSSFSAAADDAAAGLDTSAHMPFCPQYFELLERPRPGHTRLRRAVQAIFGL